MFIDDLAERLATAPESPIDALVAARLPRAQVILANNVSDWLFMETPRERWSLTKDFPCVAPPFPTLAIQYHEPEYINSDEHGRIDGCREVKDYAVFIESFDVSGGVPRAVAARFASAGAADLPAGARWMCMISVYVGAVTGAIHHLFFATALLDGTGRILSLDEKRTAIVFQFSDTVFRILSAKQKSDAEMSAMAEAHLFVPFMALSIMNCKNTTVSDVRHSDKLQRARAKRGKRPLFVYKTLNINPVRTILRAEGKSDSVGVKRALHICHGHFKDFRAETGNKPLFGKHEGIYWWDMQLRGNASAGVVAKDYNVKAPEERRK